MRQGIKAARIAATLPRKLQERTGWTGAASSELLGFFLHRWRSRPSRSRHAVLGALAFSVTAPGRTAPPIASKPFREGLRELGYVEGQNVMLEERWSEDKAQTLLDHVAEFVRLKVDVIVTHGVRGTKAAQDATKTIPS